MWVQDPKAPGPFSSENIKWTQNAAYIPYGRLKDFIEGESSGPLNPTIFIPRKRYMRVAGSLSAPDPETYLEHIYYHCAFGGTDVSKKDKNVSSLFVMRKKETSDRGCLCSFEVKRLYLHPHVAKITYEFTSHVDATGFPCHENLNPSCISKTPTQSVHISAALREWVISRLEHKYTPLHIINEHRALVQSRIRQGGAIASHTNGGYLSELDITGISDAFLKGRVALQKLDEHAVLMWSKRYKHKVFFFEQQSPANDRNQAGAASFVIGIQTTWQKRKLLAGPETLVMCETTYGSNKLQYKMFSILVVDQYYNGIPVAWIITPNIRKHDAQPWMEALRQSLHEVSIDWKPQSFVVDNLSSSTKEIRSVWGSKVQIFVSLRRVKRTWRKKLTALVKGWSTRTMLFERLGSIMDKTYPAYVSRRQRIHCIKELVEELFAECLYACTSFYEYFQREWMDPRKICTWAKCLMDLPSASIRVNAAIDSYLANLKRRNLCCKDRLVGRRISWLLDSLICDVEPQYLYLEHMYEERTSRSAHQEKLLRGAYHRARSIPNDYVELPTYGHEPAKVRSTSKPYVEYLVYNGLHEWACCTCAWSRMGDLCKHVVKVAEMYSAQSGDVDSQKTASALAKSRKLPTLSMHMMNLQAARGESLSLNSPHTSYHEQQSAGEEPSDSLSDQHDDGNLAYPESMLNMSRENSSIDMGTSVVELNKDLTYQEAELHNFLADNPDLIDRYLNSFQELKNKFIEENQSTLLSGASDDPV
ncbi:hypothetical protein MPTK1_1g03840 [Marchantia polymorpha subsp. ruderalis]|uniref:SWIM-type domain-containing protein n=2 Tax=Marchantia polymorpha TaxID=3197 RepID=A0AAF6AL88_MARPO|nr:hypothetical protein MARPO_0005s0223 [Marchantia polymorpha]BBM97208.1 hypothetical protein Mp_1g03840 [Marchantia polymorpha subsp. ruderalis]|eukprot:PTQ48600.1 hypothetical protein MARPO_0005s0223 [Marchantia polymorpha]